MGSSKSQFWSVLLLLARLVLVESKQVYLHFATLDNIEIRCNIVSYAASAGVQVQAKYIWPDNEDMYAK